MTDANTGLWGGRFDGAMSDAMEALNRSLGDDFRLLRYDVEGSRAWAGALRRAGVFGADVEDALHRGLDAVEARAHGLREEALPDEDVHTLVERLLTEEVGPDAGRLHTGRSRNDQVATDLRLWARETIRRLDTALTALAAALVDWAEETVDIVMPGYTHLQQAQPIRAGHWCLSHVWPLLRDRDRLRAVWDRADALPLGSGAIAGCPFPIDREWLRVELGFARVSENSLDATSDRDWALDLVFACAMVATHVSRLGEDLVLFSSREFGFVSLGDGYTTGSSLMPQKRNPDVAELVRGASALVVGDLVALLTLVKGLPTGYDRDLQHDKAALFRATDTLELVLPAVTGAVASGDFVREAAEGALSPELLATDVADLLVDDGVPFRQAHELVGRLFLAAERAGVEADRLPVEEKSAIHPRLAEWSVDPADYAASADRRRVDGGTARSSVLVQIELARSALDPPPLDPVPTRE